SCYIDVTAVKLPSSQVLRPAVFLCAVGALVFSIACSSNSGKKEFMWVSAPQVSLRDRVATLYNKTGIVRNAERVEVLEKQKRFARVRSTEGEEGWIELRYLVDQGVFNGFESLVKQARALPIVGFATTRSTLNIHLVPARDAEVLYQLREGEKIEILKRAVGEKPAPGAKKPDELPGKPKGEKIAMPSAQVKTTSSNSAALPAMRSAVEKRREAAA